MGEKLSQGRDFGYSSKHMQRLSGFLIDLVFSHKIICEIPCSATAAEAQRRYSEVKEFTLNSLKNSLFSTEFSGEFTLLHVQVIA